MRLLVPAQVLCALAAVSLVEAKCSSILPSSSASKGGASTSTIASGSPSPASSAQTASTALSSAFSSSAAPSSSVQSSSISSVTASFPSVSSSGTSLTTSTTASIATTTVITTSIDTSAIAVTLGPDFTKTYTYEDDTIPPLTTPPLATQNPATTDVPAATPTTEPCLVNLDDPTDMFSITTPDLIPVIPNAGQMVVLADSDFPADYNGDPYVAPTYLFKASTSIPGQYDLLVNTSAIEYVGLDSNTGLVVTVPGPSSTVTTSLFSATCAGQIQITLGGASYIWEVEPDLRHTTMVPGSPNSTNAMNILPSALIAALANFNSTSTGGSGTSKRGSRRSQKRDMIYEIGADPRCPAYPPNLFAVVGPNARPQESNGCGSGSTSSIVPQLVFGSCCDNHDFCYGMPVSPVSLSTPLPFYYYYYY